MKRSRFLSLLILVLLLCAWQVSGLADGSLVAPAPYAPQVSATFARVNNPNPKDKLFLRPMPSTESKPLGLYYNGTVVQVLDASDPVWTKVRIDALTGYMAKAYLAFGEQAQTVASMNPIVKVRAIDGSGNLPLYERPSWDAPILDHFANGTGVTVLGVDPAWIHVSYSGQSGFMPAAGLTSVDEAAQAMLTGPSDYETGIESMYGKKWLYAAEITISPALPPATLSFWGSDTGRGTEQVDVAYLAREGRLLQTIPINISAESSQSLDAYLAFEDVNFDGYLDFRICRSMGAYNFHYNYWTYDPSKGSYVGNRGFNELEANPSFDAASHRIVCTFKDGAAYYYEFYYDLDYGVPVLTEKRDIVYQDQNHRTITHWQLQNGQWVKVGTWNERV